MAGQGWAMIREGFSGEIGVHRRGYDKKDFLPFPQIIHKEIEIIAVLPGVMGAGGDAVPAAETQIVVDPHDLPAAVDAEFHGTDGNAHMAVDAVLLVYFNDRFQMFYHINPPGYNPL